MFKHAQKRTHLTLQAWCVERIRFPGRQMLHTSWHPLPIFMIYILLSTEDEARSSDERDAVDALT